MTYSTNTMLNKLKNKMMIMIILQWQHDKSWEDSTTFGFDLTVKLRCNHTTFYHSSSKILWGWTKNQGTKFVMKLPFVMIPSFQYWIFQISFEKISSFYFNKVPAWHPFVIVCRCFMWNCIKMLIVPYSWYCSSVRNKD